MFIAVTVVTLASWWYLLRRAGLSVTAATIIYDVAVISVWYAALIIWREEAVTVIQTAGLVMVMIGSLIVAVG